MKFHFIASENPEAKEALKVLIKRYDQTKLELSDVIIAIGGDGMLLKALRNSIEKNRPVFGLNKGNVGFLMNELSFDNLENRIQTARKVKMHPLFMLSLIHI